MKNILINILKFLETIDWQEVNNVLEEAKEISGNNLPS